MSGNGAAAPRREVVDTTAGLVLVEVQPDGSVVCGWFALCDRPAIGVVFCAPLGDYLPACARCAENLDLEVIPASFTFDA